MLVTTVLGFLTRKLFVDYIGTEYLGLNGLLTNVLGMLSLIEGGIGSSIVYNLYKPLAENDRERVISLVQLYRKLYRYIILGIFLLSLIVYPFLPLFVKGLDSLGYVHVVYWIFVFNTLVGYFVADKWSLINCDQKNYKLAGWMLAYQISMYIVKIGILYYFQNYILFLLVESLFGLLYNLAVSYKVGKLYRYTLTKVKYEIDVDTKHRIFKNVKALFILSIGGYLLHSTDNIIISAFVGVGMVGLYSNYTLIINQVKSFLMPLMNNAKDSVGNLLATENTEKQMEVFYAMFFLNFIIVAWPTCVLFNALNPFITWWLGDEYALSLTVVAIICLNYYIDLIRSSIMIFKNAAGIFSPDRYIVFVTAAVNLIVSIYLVQKIGLAGVLLGTSISIITTNLWNWPRLVYKYQFRSSVLPYFKHFIVYAVFTVAVTSLAYYTNLSLCETFNINGFLEAVECILLSSAVFAIMTYIFFRKSIGYKYLIQVFKNVLLPKVKSRFC